MRNRKTEEKLLTAIAALTAEVTELKKETAELRAGLDVMMEVLGDTGAEVTEEALRREKEFADGLAALMNFGGKSE